MYENQSCDCIAETRKKPETADMDEREQLKQEEESAQSFMQDEYDRLTSLVCALQADPGDDRVFETFYQATYPRILYTARHLVNSEQAALDIAQEVYIAFYRNIGNIREPRAVISWLHRVTHSIARDYREKAAVRNEDLINEGQEYLFTDVAEQRTDFVPHEQLDAQATQELIRGMLDELPEEQSRTLVYRFTEGLPLAEIAEIMDCTVSTVKSRLKYGKQKIEEQVYALEKRGIKLYSTSIPTLLLCLRWLMADRGGLSAEQARRLLAQINSAIGAAASAAAGAAQSAGTAAKAAAAKTTGSTLGTKIAAGVAAAAIVAGGVVAVPRIMQKVNPPEAVVQTEPAAEPETEPALTAEEKAVVQGDYDRNTAYLKVISELQEEYGARTQISANAYSGLLMAKLVDFDGDGTDELLCAYNDGMLMYGEGNTESTNMCSWYSVYRWDGERAVWLGENLLYNYRTSWDQPHLMNEGAFRLYKPAGDTRTYLYKEFWHCEGTGEHDFLSESYEGFTVNNGKWESVGSIGNQRSLPDGAFTSGAEDVDKIVALRQNSEYYRTTFFHDGTDYLVTGDTTEGMREIASVEAVRKAASNISYYNRPPVNGYEPPELPDALIQSMQAQAEQDKQQLGDAFREYTEPDMPADLMKADVEEQMSVANNRQYIYDRGIFDLVSPQVMRNYAAGTCDKFWQKTCDKLMGYLKQVLSNTDYAALQQEQAQFEAQTEQTSEIAGQEAAGGSMQKELVWSKSAELYKTRAEALNERLTAILGSR